MKSLSSLESISDTKKRKKIMSGGARRFIIEKPTLISTTITVSGNPGCGEYRWRFLRDPMPHITYEGYFYANRMEGYGITSYADGTVFRGIFRDNYRFGPGVESNPDLKANVGLWLGRRLVRLAWQPEGTPVIPDLAVTSNNLEALVPHRIKLKRTTIHTDVEKSLLEVLNECGATDRQIQEYWRLLYSKNCTDLESGFFEKCLFDEKAFGSKFDVLKVSEIDDDDVQEVLEKKSQIFNSWNNSEDLVQIMCHSFKHHRQRDALVSINIANVLNGNRSAFRPPGVHEMDCRAALLASYVGNTLIVAKLINDNLVHPNISDCRGNSALMYACCTDRHDVISFLIVAGASINRVNDACLTPLSMSLMHYLATATDASSQQFHSLFMHPDFISSDTDRICQEWYITRSTLPSNVNVKPVPKAMSAISMRKTSKPTTTGDENIINKSEDKDTKEIHIFFTIQKEFKLNREELSKENLNAQVQHVFEVEDIFEYLDFNSMISIIKPRTKDEMALAMPQLKFNGKNKKLSQQIVIKEDSITSHLKLKMEKLRNIESTILQLLSSGASGALGRFPLPPLAIALFSENTSIMRKLLESGADINESFPQLRNYKSLHIALSRPLTPTTLELVRCLLDSGADVNSHIRRGSEDLSESTESFEDDDNALTPLHVVVVKAPNNEEEAEIQKAMLDLLLSHGADSTVRFQGHSAIDYAMHKRLYLMETFARSKTVDLNSAINKLKQLPLTTFFSSEYFVSIPKTDRLSLLLNLLDFGADPLCPIAELRTDEECFVNVLELAQKQLEDTENIQKGDKVQPKTPKTSSNSNFVEEYIEALELTKHYAREQHIAWLQMNLLINLIDTVIKFKHRAWHMIIKEHEFPKQTSLWLTPRKSLDTWDIIKFTRKRKYCDKIIVYKTLCIVMYYNFNTDIEFVMGKLTARDCDMIEQNVRLTMKDYKKVLSQEFATKVFHSTHSHYTVCFECSQPLGDESSLCQHCSLVSFCTRTCETINRFRPNCHPCAIFMQSAEECTPQDN